MNGKLAYWKNRSSIDHVCFTFLLHMMTDIPKKSVNRIARSPSSHGLLEHRSNGDFFLAKVMGVNPVIVQYMGISHFQSTSAPFSGFPIFNQRGRQTHRETAARLFDLQLLVHDLNGTFSSLPVHQQIYGLFTWSVSQRQTEKRGEFEGSLWIFGNFTGNLILKPTSVRLETVYCGGLVSI